MGKKPRRQPRGRGREWLEEQARRLLAERMAGLDIPSRRTWTGRQGTQAGGNKGGDTR